MEMTDEKKYYTPGIEEFHVGFEYELLFGDMWIHKVIANSMHYAGNVVLFIEGLGHHSSRKEVRVKYLDHDDIVELGLTPVDGLRTWRGPDMTEDTFVYQEPDSGTYLFDYTWLKKIVLKTREDKVIFDGKINNKSELKRIMKQIGI